MHWVAPATGKNIDEIFVRRFADVTKQNVNVKCVLRCGFDSLKSQYLGPSPLPALNHV